MEVASRSQPGRQCTQSCPTISSYVTNAILRLPYFSTSSSNLPLPPVFSHLSWPGRTHESLWLPPRPFTFDQLGNIAHCLPTCQFTSTMTGDSEQPSSKGMDVTTIAPLGDLLIEAFDEKQNKSFLYRVDIAALRHTSAYFNRLLDPYKFGEGAQVSKELDTLRTKYPRLSEAPVQDLPRVKVEDIGRISKVNSIKPLFGDFLRVLHGQDTAAPAQGALLMPIANVANLAVVADRFDALAHVAGYVRRKHILSTIDARVKAKVLKMTEERLRQRVLVGVLLDHAGWVSAGCQNLIIGGSVRWRADAPVDGELPLWWDLPQGLEDELILRRDYVLDTLQSLALHFVNLYSSGERQCRLGYDSSWVCDSFQLGEMTRFFKKNNLAKFGPVLTGQDEADPYTGDIERLVEVFKSVPTYQMDGYHSHCGLRTRLVPLIDELEGYLRVGTANGVGICGELWRSARERYAWGSAKRPVAWRAPVVRQAGLGVKRMAGEEELVREHARVRDMFMAVLRDWTPKEEVRPGMRFGVATPTLRN